MSPWLYALLLTEAIWFGAVLFLLVAAFRTDLKWGLISLFLVFLAVLGFATWGLPLMVFVPLGLLAFTITHWKVAWPRFLVVVFANVVTVAIVLTHLAVFAPYVPPRYAALFASLHLPGSTPDASPATEQQRKAAAAMQAEVQLNQRDELLAREAAYNQHFAEVNATYTQLNAARAKLPKGNAAALAAFNVKLARYQQSLASVQAEKAAYDTLQHTISAAEAAAKAARQKVAGGGGSPSTFGFLTTSAPVTNGGAAPAASGAPATRAGLDAAVARIRAIVNQVTPVVTKPPDAESWHMGFHPGALKPDFDHTDIVSGREAYQGEYISMDGAPGVFYLGAQCEFNSQTKFFYTNRQLPKKKLADTEYQELVRLYRFVGKCQRDLNVSL